jgi:tetratricopeptide (TPR) repeat protein
LLLSYPRTDELFDGGTPPSAWFYAFEDDRGAAVQDLLLGSADLGSFQVLDPWAVVLPWLQGLSDTSFPADFDSALSGWIMTSWGEPIHPASQGSAGLTARAWESASLIIANFDRLPISAGILRDRVLADREFLAFMGEGPSRDPAGRAWQALAQYQKDDSLLEDWNRIVALEPGVPWYHGQYGLMGIDLLPGNRAEAGIPPPLAYGLRRFGVALRSLVADGYLNEGNARREFERLSRWAQRRYPFKEAWRSVWRQLMEHESDPLAGWVLDSLPGDHRILGQRVEEDKWQLPTANPGWWNRVQQIRLQLKRPTPTSLDGAGALLSEMEAYYHATGEPYNFVRTACNLATALPDRWLEAWIPWLDKAMRFDPANPYPATQLAMALTKTGNLRRAGQVARWVVCRFPLDVIARSALGQALKAGGELAEAEKVYRETVQRFPDDVVARNGLGGALKAAGRLAEAESVYRETVQRFPDNAVARSSLGEVMRAAGKAAEAESVYRETIRRFPDSVVARGGLGEALKAAGKLAEAEAVYRETLWRFPDSVVARNGLGDVLKAAGRLAEAESVYRETTQRFPDSAVARNGLGDVLKTAGKLAEAEAVYRETVQRSPDDVFARSGLGEALKAGGKLAEAEAVYRETVRCFPDSVFARDGLGDVLKVAGKLVEAESVYRETIRRFPNDAFARNGLGRVLKAAGKLAEAKAVYRETLRRFPNDRYAAAGLRLVDRPARAPGEGDLPDFDAGHVPDFGGEDARGFDAEPMLELGSEALLSSAWTARPTSSETGSAPDALESALERDGPSGPGEGTSVTGLSGADVRPSRRGETTLGFLGASDIDVLIQDSHLLRKWARGTGEEAMSHIREEARSLLDKLQRFLGSSPAAVMESSLLLIEAQDIPAALRLLNEASARYPGSRRVQYALARTRREAARQARQERHALPFDSPDAAGIPSAWAQLPRLEPVLLPSARLGLVRSLPYLVDGAQLKEAQRKGLGQLAHALKSMQPDRDTRNPRSYWAYRVGELVFGDRATDIRGASELSNDDIDTASRNCEQNLLTLNGLEEDLLLHYQVP